MRCFREEGSFEIYVDPCPAPDEPLSLDPGVIRAILSDAELMATLREWTSIARTTGEGLTELQMDLASEIVASIDETGRGR